MISIGDALLKLGIDTSELDKGMKGLQKKIGLGMTAMGGAILGSFALSMKAASDFEGAMREVNTMMGLSQDEFTAFSKDTQNLAVALGVDAVDSAKALYQAISAGIPRENVIEFLEIATKAAIGGVTETEIAVDGLTTVINAFKMPMSDAQRVADVMFTTVKGGKTTFEELSANMNLVVPIAASLGVTFEDVMAATATLTKQGAPTSIAMTQIRSALVALIKPSTEMQVLLDKLGFESGEDMLQSLGLAGSLGVLREAANNNNQVLATAFGRVEGLNAVLGLTGPNAEMAASDIAAMENSLGAATDAFEEMEKSSSRQMDKLKAAFKDIAISIGNVLLPILVSVVKEIKPIVENIKNWMEEHPNLTKAIILGTAALGALLVALGSLLLLMPGITSALAAFGITLHLSLGPIGLVILGITALIAAGIALWKNWDKVTHFFEVAWAYIKIYFLKGVENILATLERFTSFIPFLGDKVREVREAVSNMMEAEKIELDVIRVNRALEENITSLEENTIALGDNQKAIEDITEATDPDYVNALRVEQEELENTRKALEDQKKAYESLLEKAEDAIKQFQYERSEAGKLRITTNDVTTALIAQGWTAEELATLWEGLGDNINYADLYLASVGLTAKEVKGILEALRGTVGGLSEAYDGLSTSAEEAAKATEKAALAGLDWGEWGTATGWATAHAAAVAGQPALQTGVYAASYQTAQAILAKPKSAQLGGIAMRPMLAQVAERSPEAIIPLDRLERLLGGGRAVNIFVELDGRTIARTIGQPLVDELHLRGVKP